MAADWIKMRVDLQSHPKVVRIMSATKSDKFRVIGGLHAVWSIFDTHSVDGNLDGYTPEALDHIIGWQGFAQAMIDVEWLAWDGEKTLSMPEFTEHNGKSAKRRAEDQKRKRNSRTSPEHVRNPSADDADKEQDKKRTREEKEKNKNNKAQAPFILPDWVPAESWLAFTEMRKKIRKPLTDRAAQMAIDRLAELRAAGHDPKAVLDYSTLNSYQGLFPPPPQKVRARGDDGWVTK